MPAKVLPLLLAFLFTSVSGRAQTRRAYQGVVSLKQKTIGTLILLEVDGNNLTGWISLEKFVRIEGGTVSEEFTEFRAAGNSYKIDEKRERIIYSGPEGSGDRLVRRLTAVKGVLDEIIEGDQFGGENIAALDLNGRRRRFRVAAPSLWKRQGPPFERFRRVEELLRREVTCWVSDAEARGTIEAIEEPAGMDIPLKAPPKPKEDKKKTEKK